MPLLASGVFLGQPMGLLGRLHMVRVNFWALRVQDGLVLRIEGVTSVGMAVIGQPQSEFTQRENKTMGVGRAPTLERSETLCPPEAPWSDGLGG